MPQQNIGACFVTATVPSPDRQRRTNEQAKSDCRLALPRIELTQDEVMQTSE